MAIVMKKGSKQGFQSLPPHHKLAVPQGLNPVWFTRHFLVIVHSVLRVVLFYGRFYTASHHILISVYQRRRKERHPKRRHEVAGQGRARRLCHTSFAVRTNFSIRISVPSVVIQPYRKSDAPIGELLEFMIAIYKRLTFTEVSAGTRFPLGIHSSSMWISSLWFSLA